MSLQPRMQSNLDEALHFVWEGMRPMPPGMVLMGGTAVALYFNHRASTDLNWLATSKSLNESVIYGLDAFDEVAVVDEIHGGDGAVDCVLRPKFRGSREIAVNFVEPDGRFVPELMHPAIPAVDNGTFIAHPIDLARMKTMAMFSRRELRDYLDVGIFAEREPTLLLQAIDLIRNSKTINERPLVMALVSPPAGVLDEIPDHIQTTLNKFVATAFAWISDDRSNERDDDEAL